MRKPLNPVANASRVRRCAVQAALVLAVGGSMAAYQRAFVVPSLAAAQAQSLLHALAQDPALVSWHESGVPMRREADTHRVRRACKALGHGLLQCALFSEEAQGARLLGFEYRRLHTAGQDEAPRAPGALPALACAATPDRPAAVCVLPAMVAAAPHAAAGGVRGWTVETLEHAR